MSTRTRLTRPFSTDSSRLSTPASVSMRIGLALDSPWSYAYLATQRMPLPHICPREPSRLYISMRASAWAEGQMRMSPSLPTPVLRSLTARASAGASVTCSSKQFT